MSESLGWLRMGQRSRAASEASDVLPVRQQDHVWFNPNLDQMVEALQVSLMTRGLLEPIPIAHNAYVLHLVDAFVDAQRQLRELDSTLEQTVDEFRVLADHWAERESQYRAEVKRLEVLLSRSSHNGLEAVALARANSLVDRSGRTAPPKSPKVEKKPLLPKILDHDNDFRMSEQFRRQDAIAQRRTYPHTSEHVDPLSAAEPIERNKAVRVEMSSAFSSHDYENEEDGNNDVDDDGDDIAATDDEDNARDAMDRQRRGFSFASGDDDLAITVVDMRGGHHTDMGGSPAPPPSMPSNDNDNTHPKRQTFRSSDSERDAAQIAAVRAVASFQERQKKK
ncbi:hypothetical protein F5Y16DRAFT_405519 [Xylariaceae sp. FL0255]|nr:hypothetical protein F5Y16DRAFT_405519 [Xylariaceae sp. FL0255]